MRDRPLPPRPCPPAIACVARGFVVCQVALMALSALLAQVAMLALAAPAQAAPEQPERAPMQVNRRSLDAPGQRTLKTLEALIGPVPPGQYWCDVHTGAAGRWGGPVRVLLAPGLALAGPMPAHASGGRRWHLSPQQRRARQEHHRHGWLRRRA